MGHTWGRVNELLSCECLLMHGLDALGSGVEG